MDSLGPMPVELAQQCHIHAHSCAKNCTYNTLNTVDSYKCLYGKVRKVPGEIFNWFSLQIFRFELEAKKGLKTETRKVNVLLFKELLC